MKIVFWKNHAFFLYVILKAFFWPAKIERARRKCIKCTLITTSPYLIYSANIASKSDILVSLTAHFSAFVWSLPRTKKVNGGVSSRRELHYGVPQGSVLWPILFLLYTSPLGDIMRHQSSCLSFVCRWYASHLWIILCWTGKISGKRLWARYRCLDDSKQA